MFFHCEICNEHETAWPRLRAPRPICNRCYRLQLIAEIDQLFPGISFVDADIMQHGISRVDAEIMQLVAVLERVENQHPFAKGFLRSL